MSKKIVLKLTSGVLLCTMLLYTAPVFAFTKDETVYSKLDASGNNYNTIVSTHLVNDENQELIKDLSDLINIENTNGDEKFTQDGNSIVWQSNKNDIYYQGESQKELPVECIVKYELDGKEISAEDLAGKTGKVKITLEYINKDEHIVNIDGKDVKMYTPFIAVAGTIIKNDNNKNITISNGKVINDGTKSILIGIALPGMQESLDINKSALDIPNNIEITLDTTDFEFNNIVTFVTPKVLEESDLDFFDNLDEIYNKISVLESSSKQIKVGADQLKEGTDELKTGASSLNKYMNTAYNGAKQIQTEVEKSTKKLSSDNSDALDNKTLCQIGNQASQTASKTIEGQKEAIGAQASQTASKTIEGQKEAIGAQAAQTAKQIITSQKDVIGQNASNKVQGFQLTSSQISKIKQAVELSLEKNETYKNLTPEQKALVLPFAQSAAESAAQIAANQVATGVASETAQAVAEEIAVQVANQTAQTVAVSTASQVASQTAQTVAVSTASQVGEQTASTTAKTVANEVKSTAQKSVASQMNTLGSGLNELTTGLYSINEGTESLEKGVNQLSEGATTLATGISTFNEEGIQKICEYINGDIKDITQRVEKLTELSKQYNNFTMINGENDGNVKFIMIIDSIKKKSDEDDSKQKVVLNNDEEEKKEEEK